jgi:hypothetical protein
MKRKKGASNRECINGLEISIHATYFTSEKCAANGYYFDLSFLK